MCHGNRGKFDGGYTICGHLLPNFREALRLTLGLKAGISSGITDLRYFRYLRTSDITAYLRYHPVPPIPSYLRYLYDLLQRMQDSVGGDLTPPTGGGPMAMGGRGSGRTPASPPQLVPNVGHRVLLFAQV